MTTSQTLTALFRLNSWVAQANLAGVTHEESLMRAVPDGTHINWIVGHVVGTRCRVLPVFGQASLLPADAVASYGRPLRPESIILPFSELVDAFHQSSERLFAGLEAATEEDFAGRAPFSPGGDPAETLASLLLTCTMHEAYHLGQTGILRRVTGKDGAIKTPPGLL
jgi:hypothetical protein